MELQRHFLISPGGVVPLPMEKHFFFGRADGNNIIVDDPRSSRRHAELYWDGSSFVVLDLNSSNGTQVNGERINSAVLRDGDKIQIGLQIYTFREVDDPSDLDQYRKKITREARHMQTAEMPAIKTTLPEHDFNGTLSTMSVTEICQLMVLSRRDGMLVVMDESGEKGALYFKVGQIVGAEHGDTEGDEAALKLFQVRKGSFSFRSTSPPGKENIKRDTTSLLLEAARQDDEQAGGGLHDTYRGPPPLLG